MNPNVKDIYRPKPEDVDTLPMFRGICQGMSAQPKREATIRVFCIAAKKYRRWDLSQGELNSQDASGFFHWNGMMEEGWFEDAMSRDRVIPTDIFFSALMANDLIYEDEDEWVEDEDHVTFVDEEEEKPRLKLFSVRVVYNNKGTRKSYFTVLDTDKDAAEQTVIERVKKFRQLLNQRGHISTIQVWEVKGPFEAGQIIAEER